MADLSQNDRTEAALRSLDASLAARYEAAVREVLDFLPDPESSGADREARAIVDRVLACFRTES